MSEPALQRETTAERVLLGDEAVAEGALDAGITAAYAYPGTPSTEILETLRARALETGRPKAVWAANEKTAYEQALGVSMLGRRVLVSMKHVGLNVAADPFVNSALLDIRGGLVVVVADDPGMHSSQNEQDTRLLADFAKVPCLEPSSQQEAYDMAREAFDVSERFRVPVVLRIVTRLCHSRSSVRTRPPAAEKPLVKAADPSQWILLPANARRLWKALLARQPEIEAWSEASPANPLHLRPETGGLGVITTGIARNYLLENLDDLPCPPSHLHVGAYPFPAAKIREIVRRTDRVLVLEEGYPYVERHLRGILPLEKPVHGKQDGTLPLDGELTPDSVRRALGLPVHAGVVLEGLVLPGRPPQLCQGCPHRDSYAAVTQALGGFGLSLTTADIGCYTLGALPPYRAIESCVCMGASIGMAKGAADAGLRPVLAVIGDSTFLHSGVTPLMDAVADDTDMTVLILDNGTVGMTGQQTTVLPSSRLLPIVQGLGVGPEHVHVVEAHPKKVDELAAVIRREIDHRGLSVVIAVRECIQALKKQKTEPT